MNHWNEWDERRHVIASPSVCQFSVCLSITPSVHPPFCLFIYPSISHFLRPFICPSVCPSVLLFVCLSPSVRSSVLQFCPSNCQSTHYISLSIPVTILPFIRLFICLFLRPYIRLSARLSICPSFGLQISSIPSVYLVCIFILLYTRIIPSLPCGNLEAVRLNREREGTRGWRK